MNHNFAEHFAHEWISAWNAHDLEKILSHYEDDFEMSSPAIAQLTGTATGVLRGKTAVGAYWQQALNVFPDLRFELLSILVGVNSITLNYKGVRGRSVAEVLYFGAHHKVTHAAAHYPLETVSP